MRSCAATESGWLVRRESDVNAEPSSVPISPSDTTTIAPHAASIRPGRRMATSASRRGPNPGREELGMWTPVICVEGPIGDPGDEDVVGVVDEVVASEGVDEVALAAQVRGGDDHELTVPGGARDGGGSGEQGVKVGGRKQRRRDQDRRVVAGARLLDDGGDRRGVTDGESMELMLRERRRHGATFALGADTTLTPPARGTGGRRLST